MRETISRWKTRFANQPVATPLLSAAFVISICQVAAFPPSHPVAAVLTAIRCLLIPVIADHPMICLSMLVSIDTTAALHTGGNVPSSVLPIMLALGFVAYRWGVLAAGGASVAAVVLERCWHLWPVASDPVGHDASAMATMTITVSLVGLAFRRMERLSDKVQQRQADSYREIAQRRDTRISDAMHTAVTSELSLIARTAQRHTRIGPRSDESAWSSINRWALNALDSTHRIINGLDYNASISTPRTFDDQDNPTMTIQRTMHEWSERLTALGFTGRVTMQDLQHHPSVDRKTAKWLDELLDELFSNIVRHAMPDSRYELSAIITDTAVEITQVNVINDTADALAGGHGLPHYRDVIEHQGGAITCSALDNLWTLHVRYPL